MCLTYILVVTVATTLHASAAAAPSVKDSKVNGAVPVIVDTTLAEGGRMLRWVANYEDDLDDDEDLDGDDEDEVDEERGLGDALKKMKPAKLVKKGTKKTAEQLEKIREMADFQKTLDRAKELVYNN